MKKKFCHLGDLILLYDLIEITSLDNWWLKGFQWSIVDITGIENEQYGANSASELFGEENHEWSKLSDICTRIDDLNPLLLLYSFFLILSSYSFKFFIIDCWW